MVNVSLRVLSRPQENNLPDVYRNLGTDFDERVLPSIINEVRWTWLCAGPALSFAFFAGVNAMEPGDPHPAAFGHCRDAAFLGPEIRDCPLQRLAADYAA